MDNPNHPNTTADLLPDLPDYDPEPANGVRVGESPVPDLTLKRILRGHTDIINRIAWSPDGRFLASPSADNTIRIWDVASGECTAVLKGHIGGVTSVAWSPDGQRLASGSDDETIRIWDTRNSKTLIVLEGHKNIVYCLAWSPDSKSVISGSHDHTIRQWAVKNGTQIRKFEGHNDWIGSVAWAPDGKKIVTGSGYQDQTARIWNINTGDSYSITKNSGSVFSVSWASDGTIALGCLNSTIRIWDNDKQTIVNILEEHTEPVTCVSFSSDQTILASQARDGVCLWERSSWKVLAKLPIAGWDPQFASLAFHTVLPILATLSEQDRTILIWDLDMDALLGQISADSVRYTTAKLVLVGDSGVGKTGLGWRLANGAFKEHSSTHGQQFWPIPELGKKRNDGTECEAVLWDLAGQPDYRLVHSLFLDDVDTAMVLFDPTNRQEPLAGVEFWLNQLKRDNQNICNSILIGARTDRGTPTLTDAELQAYCERQGIQGGYIATSAKKGDGLDNLMETIKAQIPWEKMTATVTTQTFKRIKEYVLSLKGEAERKNVLVHPAELRTQLEATDAKWQFDDAEMMTAVGHLANHGYVTILRGSRGDQFILLAPDLLANLASSIVLEARRNPRGLGVLDENRLLAGEYRFPELHDLDEGEREILLDAAAVLFLEHNLCFRENFNQQIFLVFPSLINEKRPIDEEIDKVEGASYQVKGAVENVYASLVVLLGYTNTFIRTHQWQNQAQYEMGDNEICGFQQSAYRDGEIELVLYYAQDTPDPVRLTFRGLFERFISRRDLEISRYQAVFCPECGEQLARNVIMMQLGKSKNFSFCNECGTRLSLPSPEPLTRLSRREEVELDIQQGIAQRRTAFEAALVRVKSLLRDREEEKVPTCFISYAWGVPEHERWVLQMAKDLRNAGVGVLLDRWDSPPGSNLDLFLERIDTCDFVIPVGTPKLLEKYVSQNTDPVVAAELKLINYRVRHPTQFGETVLPVLLDGDAQTSLTPQLRPLVSIDFRQSIYYFRHLFNMIWRIYELPFDHPMLEELQASMSPQRI